MTGWPRLSQVDRDPRSQVAAKAVRDGMQVVGVVKRVHRERHRVSPVVNRTDGPTTSAAVTPLTAFRLTVQSRPALPSDPLHGVVREPYPAHHRCSRPSSTLPAATQVRELWLAIYSVANVAAKAPTLSFAHHMTPKSRSNSARWEMVAPLTPAALSFCRAAVPSAAARAAGDHRCHARSTAAPLGVRRV